MSERSGEIMLESMTSQPRNMPSRRRLFEGSSGVGSSSMPHKSPVSLHSESLNVREQAACLSSRAVHEGEVDLQRNEAFNESMEHEELRDIQFDGIKHVLADISVGDELGVIDEIDEDCPLQPLVSPVPSTAVNCVSFVDPATVHYMEIPGGPPKSSYKFGIFGLIQYLPSVMVGLLLNILDGLSYGMILFPLGLPVFTSLESVGLSLFYISTIVAQLVFSLGGSGFNSCIGSEMIEIVPFFHALATSISTKLDGYPRDEILATTVTAFAFSCLITGLTFFILGFLKLGNLVGFFPLHILLGCIGGVGGFLLFTGLEVAAHVEGGITYNWELLKYLCEPLVLAQWVSCLLLGCVLMYAERKLHHPLVVPSILVVVFIGFHVIVYLLPTISLDSARNAGWVFPAQSSGEPWYWVYSLYRPSLIHIGPILECIPVMFALTFFGLIHVPINIPALAAAVKNDSVNVNKELVAHGISNTLSALLGSIQNYLVYTNSVMFVKSGADTPIAGVLLAIATAGVMVAGPSIIGYIPVIVVASLIFMMAFDLITESLVDTYGSVRRQDYATMLVIALTMGFYDFVSGIMAGIILACLFFVINSARRSPIMCKMTGEHAHSTVIRHPILQKFLKDIGKQVYIIRLTGPLFFGTNGTIEKEVRGMCDSLNGGEATFAMVKYLIIDLQHVTDIDYCTVDTFLKLKRLLDSSRIRLVLSGAESAGHKIRGLKAVDFVSETVDHSDPQGVRVFATLNISLSWCENQFIKEYYRHSARFSRRPPRASSSASSVPVQPQPNRHWGVNELAAMGSPGSLTHYPGSGAVAFRATPRTSHFHMAARTAAKEDLRTVNRWRQHQQPLALLMQIVGTVTDKNVEFWTRIIPYFEVRQLHTGQMLPRGFHLIESGIFTVQFDSGYYETALAGTAFGELSQFTQRKAKIKAESPAKLWALTPVKFEELRATEPELAIELLSVHLAIGAERYARMSDYYWIAV